jgi:hypothetical protein
MLHDRHPTTQRLAELVKGFIGAQARSQLEQHVAACARCSAELKRLTSPDETLAPGTGGGFQHLSGALRFDSATAPAAFGVRSGSSAPRQRLFEAGPFELELQTAAVRSGWTISGQVLGPTDATSGVVRLIGQRSQARSELTELLEFKLPVVAAGRYRLEVEVGDSARVEIDDLEIGP